MSDQSLGGVQKVLAQITDPWDWAAAAAGAAVGFAVSAHMLGLEGGVSIPGGASAAIAIRKAGVASLQRPRIRDKARGLIAVIQSRLDAASSRMSRRDEQARHRAAGHPQVAVPAVVAPPDPDALYDSALLEGLVRLKDRVQLELQLWESDKTPKANEQFLKKLDTIEEELRALFGTPVGSVPSKKRSVKSKA